MPGAHETFCDGNPVTQEKLRHKNHFYRYLKPRQLWLARSIPVGETFPVRSRVPRRGAKTLAAFSKKGEPNERERRPARFGKESCWLSWAVEPSARVRVAGRLACRACALPSP